MNKITIRITGASTGIGKALAIKFANEGWNVAISARREDLLNKISDNHRNISSFPLDVTSKSKCKEVFILNKIQGFKYKEVAEQLGVSIKTVEAQLSKAMNRIKEALDSN